LGRAQGHAVARAKNAANHAGTAHNATGELVTAAGRVLAVTAVAPDLADAQRASAAYAAAVEFTGKQFRSDIAWRELARSARAS